MGLHKNNTNTKPKGQTDRQVLICEECGCEIDDENKSKIENMCIECFDNYD